MLKEKKDKTVVYKSEYMIKNADNVSFLSVELHRLVNLENFQVYQTMILIISLIIDFN